MDKIIRVGSGEMGSVFCHIVLKDGCLRITGVEGPKPGGNCAGGCGQIVMHPWSVTEYAPGWDAEAVLKLRQIWNRWHLNDMVAGSPAQMRLLRESGKPQDYDNATKLLAAAGLQPDPGYLHKGKPYAYGSAWLREELPADVVEWLEQLPATDIEPAWI